MSARAVKVLPITDADVMRVAEFLHAHLNPRLSAATWAASLTPSWKADAPNHGFMLVTADGSVAGTYLAFYSEREIDGRPERFCNLAGWCVLDDHRLSAVRLLKALLAQDGYHFTDLSPSGSVVPINTRFGFAFLDTRLAAVPNLPWLSFRGRVTSDPRLIEDTLTGAELQHYRDHKDALAARHVLLRDRGEWCYVVFRRDRPKNLPIFASVVHVSHPAVFRHLFRPFTRHLLLRHGLLATLIEQRLAGFRPMPSADLGEPRRKMFRSPTLRADQIDCLYSELVSVPF